MLRVDDDVSSDARGFQGQRVALARLGAFLGGATVLASAALVVAAAGARWRFQEPCASSVGGSSEAQALFDYMSFYACAEAFPLPAKVVLLLVWLAVLISLLASTADLFFVPQLDALSRDLALTEDVAGVTLLALGNGMPDVMTATSAINHADDFSLTMGEFLGAANFILGLVLGCVLLSSRGATCVEPRAFWRDASAYLVVLVFMVALTWDNVVTLPEALAFFGLYAVYVGAVAWGSRRVGRADSHEDLGLELVGGSFSPVRLPHEGKDLEAHFGVSRPAKASDSAAESASAIPAGGGCDLSGGGGADAGSSSASTSTQLGEDMQFILLDSESECENDDRAFACVDDGREECCEDTLEGFDTSEVEGFALVQLVMELPFTVARHASIPAATWNRRRRFLAALCPAMGAQVLLLSFGGWGAFRAELIGLPVWAFCAAAGAAAGFALLATSTPTRRPRWHAGILLFAFGMSIAWFNMLANECVAVLETFGLNFGISSSVLGITVLAWGNSVGDLVADTALARQGRSRTAVAGCFGSPLLSDLLGLGVALTSYTLSEGPLKAQLSLQNKVAAAFLAATLLVIVVGFSWYRYSCPRCVAYVLLSLYAVFIIVSCALETKFISGAVAAA